MGVCVYIVRAPRAANNDGSLVVEKEEELVLHRRSAHIAAKLVAPESILHVVAPVPCVKVAVAHELEEAAVPLIRAAPGGHGNYAARRKAINRAEVVRDQPEFLRSVWIGRGRVGAQVVVHVGDAVNHVVGAADAAAVG